MTSVTIPNYHAYLVRIWRDSSQAPWRASVTHVATGEVHRFANPEKAWAYVRARLEGQPGHEEGENGDRPSR